MTNERAPFDMSNTTSDAMADEESPLLPTLTKTITAESKQEWEKPVGFLFIEIGKIPYPRVNCALVLTHVLRSAIFTNVFLAGFDGTVTSSTYALISSELRSSNLASWITTSYLLTSTAVQPLYGRFSDIFGRRACLLSATALFGIGCLGCSCSHNMILLIIMRAVCGLGGGGLMTMSTIVLSSSVQLTDGGTSQQPSSTPTSSPGGREACIKHCRISSMERVRCSEQLLVALSLKRWAGEHAFSLRFPLP